MIATIVVAFVIFIILWVIRERLVGRGHLGVNRTVDQQLSEAEFQYRRPF